MLEVLVLGDLHLCDVPPLTVLAKSADHTERWANLQSHLVKSAGDTYAHAVVTPGDMFHRPNAGTRSTRDLVRIWRGRGREFAIASLGQHDVKHHQVDQYENNPIGIAFDLARAYGGIIVTNPLGTSPGFWMQSIPYGAEWKVQDEVKLVAAHVSMGEDRTQARYRPEDLDYNGARLVCVGDIHSGIQPRMVGEALVVNPGPLLPTSRVDLARFGYAYKISLNNGKDYEVEAIEQIDLLGGFRNMYEDWLNSALETQVAAAPRMTDISELASEVKHLRALEVSDTSRIEAIAMRIGASEETKAYLHNTLEEIQ